MGPFAICAAAFLGGIVSGFAGFAFSAVAGAILLHVLAPILAIPLMMSCTIVSQAATLAVFRRFVDWRAALARIVGWVGGRPVRVGMQVLAVAMLAMRPGVIRGELLRYTLLALPALAAGVILGLFLFSRIDNARFRAATLWLLVVSGLAMMF